MHARPAPWRDSSIMRPVAPRDVSGGCVASSSAATTSVSLCNPTSCSASASSRCACSEEEWSCENGAGGMSRD
jgi:hypothetical protein